MHAFAIVSLLAITTTAVSPAVGEPTKSSEERTHAEAHDAHEHAAPGAVPGSHEDWCERHQVPESLCSRCNPALIPAFKATGDWCEEHDLPESQCLVCNPDLKIERPPKSGQER